MQARRSCLSVGEIRRHEAFPEEDWFKWALANFVKCVMMGQLTLKCRVPALSRLPHPFKSLAHSTNGQWIPQEADQDVTAMIAHINTHEMAYTALVTCAWCHNPSISGPVSGIYYSPTLADRTRISFPSKQKILRLLELLIEWTKTFALY
jgi:hypothetical protein